MPIPSPGMEMHGNMDEEEIIGCDETEALWEQEHPPGSGQRHVWRVVANNRNSRVDGKVPVQHAHSIGNMKTSITYLEGTLCKFCQPLLGNTHWLLEGLERSLALRESFSVGYLEDIFQRQHCGLCRAISAALPLPLWGSWLLPKSGNTKLALRINYRSSTSSRTIEIYDEIDAFFRQKLSPGSCGHSLPGYERFFRQGNRSDAISELYFSYPNEVMLDALMGRMRSTSPAEVPTEAAHVTLKRYFSPLKAALEACQTTHHSCTGLMKWAMVPENLLLIDIGRRCIVSADYQSRYLALSYVWGNANMLMTTTTNLDDLKKPWSLKYRARLIPKVIKDAILVVEALGERYLWVDALCIVQDDVVGKHDQIHQMHSIYGQASLTLVAMRGKDANAKLFNPGHISESQESPTTGAYERIVGGQILVARTPWLSPLLSASYYNKRGWTFQERILSTRCLYFTENNVYFQCSETLIDNWGTALEGPSLNTDLHRLNPFLSASKKIYQMNNIKKSTWKHQEQPSRTPFKNEQFLAYANLLSEYTTKQLSYEEDILDAFDGIIQHIFERSSEAAGGLPERDLDMALLWFPERRPFRRSATRTLTLNREKMPCDFPSWSWVGWSGSSIIYPIDCGGEASTWERRQLKSCIGNICISNPGRRKRYLNVHRNLPVREPAVDNEWNKFTSLGDVPNNVCTDILLFSADFVRLDDLQIDPHMHLSSSAAEFDVPPVYGLHDPRGQKCGMVIGHLPIEFSQQERSDLSSFEWILLSQNQDLAFRPQVSKLWSALKQEQFYDVSCFLYDEWVTGNVMLIKWSKNVATRVALGMVHLDAWDRVCRGSKVVRLA
ncbi:HET-domain-containing protein [Delitschia confertaspora ATCC 74209]|uniref:HET-domain-containing protein n=1 Tax=Delitschia confertaspora ATCC 74209 TaxID=1513339 RepID=A0A9P4MTP2_9PLEO|nr:HET-domain-containing protein [Delitschia confertaspora ATCC 74209]